MGLMKVWKKSVDVFELMFQDVLDMASLFIVGVPFSLISITAKGARLQAVVTQMSQAEWQQLWDTSECGTPFQVSNIMAKCGNTNYSSPSGTGGTSGGRQQGASPSSNVPSGGAAGGGTGNQASGSGSGPAPNDGEGDGGDDDAVGELPTLCNVDGGEKKLQITVVLRNNPGEGTTSPLSLAVKPESRCMLSSVVEFLFSEVEQPPPLAHHNQKMVEVTMSSKFQLPNYNIVVPEVRHSIAQAQPEQEVHPGNDYRVGIVHDMLSTSFTCTSSAKASVLLTSKAMDISTINILEKNVGTQMKGWSAGVQLGGSAGAPGSNIQGMGNFRHSSSNTSASERQTVVKVPALLGTKFMLIDSCDTSLEEPDVLSYTAVHSPSLIEVSRLEDAGLSLVAGVVAKSALGLSTKVVCKGKMLLMGSATHRHRIEIKRKLGEFLCKVGTRNKGSLRRLLNKGRSVHSTTITGEQAFCIDFMINHGFSWDVYRGGNLFWALKCITDSPVLGVKVRNR